MRYLRIRRRLESVVRACGVTSIRFEFALVWRVRGATNQSHTSKCIANKMNNCYHPSNRTSPPKHGNTGDIGTDTTSIVLFRIVRNLVKSTPGVETQSLRVNVNSS